VKGRTGIARPALSVAATTAGADRRLLQIPEEWTPVQTGIDARRPWSCLSGARWSSWLSR